MLAVTMLPMCARSENDDWNIYFKTKSIAPTTIANVIGSAAAITFDDSGNVTSVTAYLNEDTVTPGATETDPDIPVDVTYSATFTNADNVAGIATSSVVSKDGAEITGATTSLTVDRSVATFGFATEYMAMIGWDVDKTTDDLSGVTGDTYSINGLMLAGMQSTDISSKSGQVVNFVGKGKGLYGDSEGSYKTIFDMVATVNFTDTKVTFSTRNSCKANGCANNPVNALDFTTASLSYAGSNAISSAFNIGGLTGWFDARFYGTETGNDVAKEIGGSFALAGGGSYYYGAFGGYVAGTLANNYSLNNFIGGSGYTLADTTHAENTGTYTTITGAATDSANPTKTIKLLGLSAYDEKDNADYIRGTAVKDNWEVAADITIQSASIATIDGSAAEITFDNAGNITEVTAYLNDGSDYSYTASGFASSGNVMVADIDSLTGKAGGDPLKDKFDGAATKTITVDRSDETFGFETHYMAMIGWEISRTASDFDTGLSAVALQLTDSSYAIEGMMLAGMQLSNADLITAGTGDFDDKEVDFNGKGKGVYGDVNGSYNTIFDVTATVNFTADTVAISTSKTCRDIANADCANGGNSRLDTLNFSTAAFSILDNSVLANNLNNQTINVGSMAGTLDARFYGADLEEFGGSFALANTTIGSEEYYYGVFGASSYTHNVVFAQQTSSHPNLPTAPVVPHETFQEAYADNTDSAYILPIVMAVEDHYVQQHTRAADQTYKRFDDFTVVDEAVAFNQYANGYVKFKVADNVTPPSGKSTVHNSFKDATLYVGNNEYLSTPNIAPTSATQSGHSDSNILGYSNNLNQTEAQLTLSNDIELSFNNSFTSKYMISIYWNISRDANNLSGFASKTYNIDNIYNETTDERKGYGLAGNETAGADIPTDAGDITFYGGGNGTIREFELVSKRDNNSAEQAAYDAEYNIIANDIGGQGISAGRSVITDPYLGTLNAATFFDVIQYNYTRVTYDVKADVNFGNRTVKFAGDNVKKENDGTAVTITDENGDVVKIAGSADNDTTGWDFESSTIRYRAGDNNIIGSVRATHADNDAIGSINARFYGPTATEIGGTIIMQSDDQQKGFTGSFGACQRSTSQAACGE